jgi:hypothetical protein
MPIPIQKILLTTVRFTMRPINNTVLKYLKEAGKESRGYLFFENFGQRANKFEVKMNRALIRSKGLGEIPELSKEIAFNKGVEWFTEVFIFYGILISIAAYEIAKAAKSSQKTKILLQGLVQESKQHEVVLSEL